MTVLAPIDRGIGLGETILPKPWWESADLRLREHARRIQALNPAERPSQVMSATDASKRTVGEKLFDAVTEAKRFSSSVSMHMPREWLASIHRQLDFLHDPEDWNECDLPLDARSFRTFMMGLLSINPDRLPGLGMMDTGMILAGWTVGRDRLTIEFLPFDQVRWIAARYDADGQPRRHTGSESVRYLRESLIKHNGSHWFRHDQG